MMIEHDHIDAASLQPLDGTDRRRAAIHRQQQRGRKFGQAILHAALAQAVSFLHPMRQITTGFPAKRGQNFEKQRAGSHAIDVVIAEDHDTLFLFTGAKQPFHGGGHVGKQERVGEMFEARLQKSSDGFRFAQAAIQKALRQQRRDFEFF